MHLHLYEISNIDGNFHNIVHFKKRPRRKWQIHVPMHWFWKRERKRETCSLFQCVVSVYFGVRIHRVNGKTEVSNELTIKNSQFWNEIGGDYALVIHQQINNIIMMIVETCAYFLSRSTQFSCFIGSVAVSWTCT